MSQGQQSNTAPSYGQQGQREKGMVRELGEKGFYCELWARLTPSTLHRSHCKEDDIEQSSFSPCLSRLPGFPACEEQGCELALTWREG